MATAQPTGFKSLPSAARAAIVIAAVVGTLFGAMIIAGIVSAVTSPTSATPATPEPSVQAQPMTTTQEVQETESIPFGKVSKEDATKASGSSSITTNGVNGVKTNTYKLTLVDGLEKNRELIKEETTTVPINEVTTVGTYVAPVQKKVVSSCDPNYSGACVPIDSDVDCVGGKGNGPSYVSGPVRVIGSDIYGLDGNGDGYGCE
jgi:hypothetical protein